MNDRQMNQQDRAAAIAMRRKLKGLGLTAIDACVEHRAVVFDAGSRAAAAVARCIADDGAALLPVDVGMPYPASPKVRAARRSYEAVWGLIGSIVEPEDAAELLDRTDGLVVVTDVWDGRPSAPIAAFLEAHRDRTKPVEFLVLADEAEVGHGFLAQLAEHLNHGTPVHVSYLPAAEASGGVDVLRDAAEPEAVAAPARELAA